jgi:HipA-like C-terminal domain
MERRTNRSDTSRLTLALQAQGLTPARALAEFLQVSQPTLSRWIAQLGPAVERVGAARHTQYALRRDVRNLGSTWPLYGIDEKGHPFTFGELRAVHGGFRLIPSGNAPAWFAREYPTGVFPGLPFFLQDMAPQGYLGRAIARDLASRMRVPSDPREWNDDDVVAYLLNDGADLPGNFVLGDRALEQALRRPDALPSTAIPTADRASIYPERAAAAQRGERFGSSAGGEQPKFLVTVCRAGGEFVPVLVKFSAAENSQVSQRWADLLLCEHLAAEVLSAHGIDGVRTQVLDAGGRRFLEVERFDRTETAGRRGVLSLGALEDGLTEGTASDWAASASLLESAGWLGADQARELRWRWCFGDLIANSDMHRSNASLQFGDEVPYRLTPSYDMLPMLYAPGAQGDLSSRVFEPRPPLPAVAAVWAEAAPVALDFWARVTAEERMSAEFRALAQTAGATVQRMLARFGRA